MNTPNESDFQFELKLTQQLARVIDTPRALSVHILINNQEWEQLARLPIEARDYQDVGKFADDYLITSLLKKSVNLPLSVDRKLEAYLSFFEAEETNRRTNEWFSMRWATKHPEWWWRAQKYLRRVMGPLDTQTLDRILDRMHHGPGAVVGLGRAERVASSKFDTRPTVTESLIGFSSAIMGETWSDYHSIGHGPKVVEGNRLSTALKNALTDRSTCTGASLNVFGQLGIGDVLTDRLVFFGVDLHDQWYNQYLASKAQEWHLATIDLSNASNLIASEPVYQLCSDRWGHLLRLFREERCSYTLDGTTMKSHKLEMLGAMGNGFTFPLETTLFLSVVRAIVPQELHSLTSVYGDDIICPQAYADEVITALEYLGFKVNDEKSFLAGSFFESCGTDWLHGHNVRPFFLRRTSEDSSNSDDPNVQTPDAFRIPYPVQMANALRLWSIRRASIDGYTGSDARFHEIWLGLVTSCPKNWRLPVPVGLGDSGLYCSSAEVTSVKWNVRPVLLGGLDKFQDTIVTGWEGYAVKHMILTPEKVDRKTFGVVLSNIGRANKSTTALEVIRRWHLSKDESLSIRDLVAGAKVETLGQEPVRGLFGRPRARWAFCQYWPDGLDWVGSYEHLAL